MSKSQTNGFALDEIIQSTSILDYFNKEKEQKLSFCDFFTNESHVKMDNSAKLQARNSKEIVVF